MMESLRTEMEGRNIGVSVYCPGLVRSSIFDIERNRPASHGAELREPPKPPPLKPGARPIDIMAAAMDPLEAGRQVLAGIRRNDLYILSHAEFEPVVRQRVTLMLASFSRKPVPEGRRLATETITPDIYAAELAKMGLLKQPRRRKVAAKKAKKTKKTKKTVGMRKHRSAKKPASKGRRRASARRS
jgi:hypothetical protein